MQKKFLAFSALLLAQKGYWDLPENDFFPQKKNPQQLEEVETFPSPLDSEKPLEDFFPSPIENNAPSSEQSFPPVSGEEVVEAEKYWQEKKFREAIKNYQSLLIQEPINSFYLYRLGEAYRQLGEYEQGKQFLERAVKADPSYVDAYIALGLTDLVCNNLKSSKKNFKKAYALQPTNADALYGLALVLIRKDRRVEAYSLLEKALTYSEGYNDVVRTKANLDLYFNRFEVAYDQLKKVQGEENSRVWDAKLFSIKSLFRPSSRSHFMVSQEEEVDLISQIKTTRIVTKTLEETFSLPLPPHVNLSGTFRWYQEQQQNLVAGRNNYDVNTYNAFVGLDYRWRRYWQALANIGIKLGRNRGINGFQFQNKDRWESALSVRYSPPKHTATVGIVQDSFIARDPIAARSFFLKIDPAVFANYNYQFAPFSNIGGEYWTGWYYGQTNNHKKSLTTKVVCCLPDLPFTLLFGYQGEYSHFKKVDSDYYSYRRRMQQKVHLEYLKLYPGVRFSLLLAGGWERAVDFTNVADITLPGSPPPQVIDKDIFYFYQFVSSLTQSFGERLEVGGSFSYYCNTNHYTGAVAKIYLRMVF